jgi:hypothetical protein
LVLDICGDAAECGLERNAEKYFGEIAVFLSRLKL